MQIIELELHQYLRLMLNNIQRIKITPESKIHLILGTNGSGKSALIREMSPLPANRKDYGPQGYKKITIRKGSHTYHLTSDFSGQEATYSFIKDDEELNPGHKLTDYRKLVSHEFNITQDIHDLSVGRLRFTQMSIGERRSWLTKISDADFTYALQYFKKLSELYRDITGARKLQQARLVQEKDKLITPEVEAVLRKEIATLSELSDELLEMRGQATDVKGSVTDYLGGVDVEIRKSLGVFKGMLRKYEASTHLKTPEQIDQAILEAHNQLHTDQTLISQMCLEIDKQQQVLDKISASGVEPTQNVDVTIQEYRDAIASIRKEILLPLVFENAYLALQSASTISETFSSLFNSLPSDPSTSITRISYETKVATHQTLSESIRQLEYHANQLQVKKKELEHIKSHNQLECPSCNHTWIQGYSDGLYQSVLDQIKKIEDKLESDNLKLGELSKAIEYEHTYLKTLSAVAQLMSSWPLLKPYWEHISAGAMIRTNPKAVLQSFTDLKWDLERYVRIDEMQLKLNKALELKDMMLRDHQSSVQALLEDNEQQQMRLSAKQKEMHAHRRKLDTLVAYKNTFKNIVDTTTKLEALLQQRDSRIGVALQELHRMYYSEIIQAVQLEISNRRHVIGKVDIQKALIKDIETQIAELDKSSEVLKIAVKELSPNEGLIAKGLMGFINHFVHQMNVFIRKVWLHPLEICPIVYDAADGVDLDYRFEMKVGDRELMVPDIREGSTAQTKIIDLAFTVVAMKYLHLDQAPLFLDEFAASMDHAHRESAFHLVTTLGNTSNYSQIFMISHYENSYSSLVNADVTVLCPHNIILPKNLVYNQRTLIE